MLGRYKQLKKKILDMDNMLGELLENDADTWSRIQRNKTLIDSARQDIEKLATTIRDLPGIADENTNLFKNLDKKVENIGDWMQDIDDIQMLHTVAIDELRDNVALILDHLGVEVVQPSDRPTIKKKGSK